MAVTGQNFYNLFSKSPCRLLDAASTLPIFLFAAVPEPSYRFPCFRFFFKVFKMTYETMCVKVSLLVVLPVDVFHLVSNFVYWVRDSVSTTNTSMSGFFRPYQCASCPWRNTYPLLHVSATLLSPHICTAVPSLIVLSGGPTSLGSILFSLSAFTCHPNVWPVYKKMSHVHQGDSREGSHIHFDRAHVPIFCPGLVSIPMLCEIVPNTSSIMQLSHLRFPLVHGCSGPQACGGLSYLSTNTYFSF